MTGGFLSQDDLWMARALGLAIRGRGSVEPNPMVGCVIVKDGRVIGEGFHERFGGPHAEPNALSACTEPPAGATAYVTLEPCCHTNKKTPPCAPRLIEAKLARVVVGTLDPNPNVSGRGVTQLRSAGIRVDVLDSPHAKQLIAPFIALTVHHRPYVTLKWAQSADGKMAAAPGKPRLMISNAASLRAVHELRARCDAILVGLNTVLADDPLLTVRDVEPMRPLRRSVLDRDLAIPLTSRLVESAKDAPLEIFCSDQVIERESSRVQSLRTRGVNITPVPTDAGGRLGLAAVLHQMGKQSVTNLLVEPGPTLARSLILADLWDRVWVFRSSAPASDQLAAEAPGMSPPAVGKAAIDGDSLIELLNPASKVFFSPDESSDFHLWAHRAEFKR